MSVHPRDTDVVIDHEAVTIAATREDPVWIAPEDGVISNVQFTPNATITGANTNTRKHEVINKGQAGAGSAVAALLQYDSGVNGVAFDEKPLTLGSAANRAVVKGDVISFKSSAVGTGIADPGGSLRITFSRS